MCSLLLERGADPNSQGEFQRSPLWRAAFLGHEALLPVLLAGGCDPRIANEGGELPEHIASSAAAKEILQAWDTSTTDAIVARWQARRAQEEATLQAENAKALQVLSFASVC